MAKNAAPTSNNLTAAVRTRTGKGASRLARREGRVPVVLYGHGTDPQHLEINAHDFAAVLRNSGTNAVLTLDIAGKEQLALTKQVVVGIKGVDGRVICPPVEYDPTTGELIGCIDLTGDSQIASAQTLGLVRATVMAIENHLALQRLLQPAPTPAAAPRLTVLGGDRPRWVATGDDGQPHQHTLSGRHADILVLLSRHPEGLSADHLAVLLDDKDLDVVTVRAEMSRLRRVIGPEHLSSRPYRLLAAITTDVGEVFDALDADDIDTALSRYQGELLPQSVSPAIARLRTQLSATLRAAVVAGSAQRPALLRRWLELPEGRDDRDGWEVLHRWAPDSAARARADGHLAGLDFELG